MEGQVRSRLIIRYVKAYFSAFAVVWSSPLILRTRDTP